MQPAKPEAVELIIYQRSQVTSEDGFGPMESISQGLLP